MYLYIYTDTYIHIHTQLYLLFKKCKSHLIDTECCNCPAKHHACVAQTQACLCHADTGARSRRTTSRMQRSCFSITSARSGY